MTQATEFRKAQAEALKDRISCEICECMFLRKELQFFSVRIHAGKVGTADQLRNMNNFEEAVDVVDVFSEKFYLICGNCVENHGEILKTINLNAKGQYHSERSPSDLIWEEV